VKINKSFYIVSLGFIGLNLSAQVNPSEKTTTHLPTQSFGQMHRIYQSPEMATIFT
jgi:hypothetical protein